ncbi:MAG: SH3 domain-containing protein [Rhodobacterales bacterium]
MMRFILLTFAFLGWSFYTLSGGADYHPVEGSRQAEAIKARTNAERRLAQAPSMPSAPPSLPDVAQAGNGITATRAVANLGAIAPEFAVLDKHLDLSRPMAAPQAEQPNARLANLTLAEPAAFAQAAGFAPVSDDTDQMAATEIRDLRRITGSSVNMRSGPGTRYGVLNRVSRGTEVEVLESYQQGWLRLRVLEDQRIGWVAATLVSGSQG